MEPEADDTVLLTQRQEGWRPMTDQDLDAFEALLKKATPLPDTGHGVTCSCPECDAAWRQGLVLAEARAQMVERAPALLAEIRAYQQLLQSARRAFVVGGLVDLGDTLAGRVIGGETLSKAEGRIFNAIDSLLDCLFPDHTAADSSRNPS